MNSAKTEIRAQYMYDLTNTVEWCVAARESLNGACSAIARGQGCAGWIHIRNFQITATVAATALIANENLCNDMASTARRVGEKYIEGWFNKCIYSWFSASRSKEAMMRGACNQDVTISALEALHALKVVFEVDILQKRDRKYYACSPDGVVRIDLNVLDGADGWSSTRYAVYIVASLSQRRVF